MALYLAAGGAATRRRRCALMKRLASGSTVKVTRKTTQRERPRAQLVAEEGDLPHPAPVRHSSRLPRAPLRVGALQTVRANLTAFAARRLFVLAGAAVHAELFQLAGEGIAAPAQELRRLLAVALGALERRADQHALELRLRRIEQRRAAAEQRAARPSSPSATAQSASRRRRRWGRRAPAAGPRGAPRSPGPAPTAAGTGSPARARCPASSYAASRSSASAASAFGSTPSSCAAMRM